MISPFVQTTIYSSSADSEIDINLFFSFFSSPKQDLSSPSKVSVPMNSAKFFIFLILIAAFLLGMGYPSRAVLLPPLMDLSNLVFANPVREKICAGVLVIFVWMINQTRVLDISHAGPFSSVDRPPRVLRKIDPIRRHRRNGYFQKVHLSMVMINVQRVPSLPRFRRRRW